MSLLVSPTGTLEIRNDTWGAGSYGARRGSRRHKGNDFPCVVGQEIVSPLDGLVVRLARPYASDDVLEGVVIKSTKITIKMFYFRLDRSLLRQNVRQGQVIGFAQDVGKRYRGMTPHVHLQVDGIDPLTLMDLGT